MIDNDARAESVASQLIEVLGFGPLFLGDLARARGLSEPGDVLYNKQLTLSEAQGIVETKS